MAYTPGPSDLCKTRVFRVADWLQPTYLKGYPTKIGIG